MPNTTADNAPSTARKGLFHHAWRYASLALFVIALITALVPLSFASDPAQEIAVGLGIVCSGWFFLGIFWNIFVIAWEASRKIFMVPGAVVGLDLLIWLYGVFVIVWGSFSIVNLQEEHDDQYYYNSDEYLYEDDYYWRFSDHDFAGATACVAIFLACAAITTVLHFALFVAGCINEEKRRKSVNNALANAEAGAIPRDLVERAVAKQAEIELQEREFGNARQ